jgi:hypothetical protein
MPHQKGFTNNPHGRPKGVLNKSTKEIRSILHSFVENNIEGIQKDFDQLDSGERLKVLEKFIQYLIPRYSPIQTIEKDEEDLKPLVIVLTRKEADEMEEAERMEEARRMEE